MASPSDLAETLYGVLECFASQEYADSLALGRADLFDSDELLLWFEDLYEVDGRFDELPRELNVQLRTFHAAAVAAIAPDRGPPRSLSVEEILWLCRATRGLPVRWSPAKPNTD